MAQKRMRFPELERIVARLKSNERQDLVVLIVPSHDQNDAELPDQEIWAGAAMDLFAVLYRGATAFQAHSGIYKREDGKVLRDKPILIESYVDRADLEDEAKLKELLKFAKRMGKETRQAAVAIVINSVFHEITDFR